MLCGRNKWIIQYLIWDISFLWECRDEENFEIRCPSCVVKELRSCYHQLQNHPSRQSLFKPWADTGTIHLSLFSSSPPLCFFSVSVFLSLPLLFIVQTKSGVDRQGPAVHYAPQWDDKPPFFFHPNQPPVTSAASTHNIAQMNGWTFMEREAKLMWMQI